MMILFYFLTSQQDQLRLSLNWKAKQRRTRWPQADLLNGLVALESFMFLRRSSKGASQLPTSALQSAPHAALAMPASSSCIGPAELLFSFNFRNARLEQLSAVAVLGM